jgi:mRNA interferase MazF
MHQQETNLRAGTGAGIRFSFSLETSAVPLIRLEGAQVADPMRGEVWLVDLGTGQGHEQGGQRPVLVVSDDVFNMGLSGLVMVVPLTSQVHKSKHIPAHILVNPPEGGLKTPSIILCDQLRTLSKSRLGKSPWGAISTSTLAGVEVALRALLNL